MTNTGSRGTALSPASMLALLADGNEVSGSALASHLGITRAAVWKHIEQLRELGLSIEAAAGRGYRLATPVDLLDAAAIRDAISAPQRDGVGDIDVRWQIDSTSSELLRRMGDATAPRACLAEIQTAGRGRRGRAWRTPLGGGLALSFSRRFDVGMAALSGLSLVAGIAVLQALSDGGVRGPALKWPNDVVADGRKLAGILVELGGDALGPCHAVIGIGINVRMSVQVGKAIDQPWVDVASLTADPPSRNLLAGRILSRLAEALDLFAASGFAAFQREYAQHDALLGRDIVISGAGGSSEGIARGVNVRGALEVERDGVVTPIDSGEISVRTHHR